MPVGATFVMGKKGSSELMRRVLMVAQRFPPAGGVGTFRATKFVKYLPSFGWEPVVLTLREDCFPEAVWLDRGLERDIPQDIRVHRTGIWRTSLVNDEGIRWLPRLLPALVRAIMTERPEILYLTGGPFFPLIAGPVMRGFFHLAYVVDLRDPWKLARRESRRSGLNARIGGVLTSVLEPWVVRFASKVICVSETMCAEYREHYKHLSAGKFVVIPNGYDPEDFDNLVPIRAEEPTIVYAGKFRTSEGFRDPVPFFEAMKLLAARGRQVNLLHIGREEPEILRLAEETGVADRVFQIGPLSYSETIAHGLGADALLLIAGGQPTEQTGKVFDYIGCERPILAIAPSHGEIAKVLRDIPGAWLVEPSNPETICSLLVQLCFCANISGGESGYRATRYERKHLAEELAMLLNAVQQYRSEGRRGRLERFCKAIVRGRKRS